MIDLPLPQGLYQAKDGQIFLVTHRFRAQAQQINSDALKHEAKTVAGAVPLKDPNWKVIWELAGKPRAKQPPWRKKGADFSMEDRTESFCTAVVVSRAFSIDDFGYFRGQLWENYAEELGRKVAQVAHTWHFFANRDEASDSRERAREKYGLFLDWVRDPTPEKWRAFEPEPRVLSDPLTCPETGKAIWLRFNGESIQACNFWEGRDRDAHGLSAEAVAPLKRFQSPDGRFPKQTYEIEVTSGALAFGQWWQDEEIIQEVPDSLVHSDEYSPNAVGGRIAISRWHEQHNRWHIFSRSHSLYLYRKGTNYRIGCVPEEALTSEAAEIWRGWEEIAPIPSPTGLRWISIVDAKLFASKVQDEDEVMIVPIPNGRYRLLDHFQRPNEAPCTEDVYHEFSPV